MEAVQQGIVAKKYDWVWKIIGSGFVYQEKKSRYILK